MRGLMAAVFVERAPGDKQRQRLLEWAVVHDEPHLVRRLEDAGYAPARAASQQAGPRAALTRHLEKYSSRFFKDVLAECDLYGLEHRSPMNLTPLMAACAAGNVGLADALLARGSDPEAVDHRGRNALHWTLLSAFGNPEFARGPLPGLYDRVAPERVDVASGGRLVRIDRSQSEYLLFQTFWALTHARFRHAHRGPGGAFDTASLLEAWKHFPAAVLSPQRRRRPYLSAVLARNEAGSSYAYGRALFVRASHGFYRLNPSLALRRRGPEGDSWTPLGDALNLDFAAEFVPKHLRPPLDGYRVACASALARAQGKAQDLSRAGIFKDTP